MSRADFVETLEYHRFAEFCEACTEYRYIGLCCGPAGVGKTLSGRRYANWDRVNLDVEKMSDGELKRLRKPTVIFCTASVSNTPKWVENTLRRLREHLVNILKEPHKRMAKEAYQACLDRGRSQIPYEPWETNRPYERLQACWDNEAAVTDPTRLILIDEADRLAIKSLEQVRATFDDLGIGVVLIGMSGLEKKLSRYAQLYSRVGFVHEFRPLSRDQVTKMLGENRWLPRGVRLPPLEEDTIAAITRTTGGNFRLIQRLLSQMQRVVDLNDLQAVTPDVVASAREILVVGR